jgi:hypothetical protein
MKKWQAEVKMPDGSKYVVKSLLGKGDSNHKLEKSDKAGRGYMTVGLSLAPAKLSGYEMCKGRSKGCTAACLNTAGRGQQTSTQRARIAKTILLNTQPSVFIDRLQDELYFFEKKAAKEDKKLSCRLNVVSDYPWEEKFPSLFTMFPGVQFYDYTKILSRINNFGLYFLPYNYHLTFSRSESNDKIVNQIMNKHWDVNIAVVFSGPLPKIWRGRKVIDGDTTDLRFLDPRGIIVGLKAKGRAKSENSGFVIQLPVVESS